MHFKLYLNFLTFISISAWNVAGLDDVEIFTPLSDNQLIQVKNALSVVGGIDCANLFQTDFEEYLICASQYRKKLRFPKQEDGGDGGEDEPGFVAETLQTGVPQVLGILTEAFTGINQVVNQSSAGQSQSLPNWILNGVTNLFGQVGQVVGIKPPALPTPPPYFNLPPARPVGGGGAYPSNSLSQGQRHHRPTLVPRSTTKRPFRTTSRPAGIEVGFSPFTVQYVGPASAPAGSESGQFFPAPPPRRVKPRTTTTLRAIITNPPPQVTFAPNWVTTPPRPHPPIEFVPPPPQPESSFSNSGFHSELLSSFASTLNKLKQPSVAAPTAISPTLTQERSTISNIEEDEEFNSPTFSSSYIQSKPNYHPPPPPPHPAVPSRPHVNISPVSSSLWQAIAHIKTKPSTPSFDAIYPPTTSRSTSSSLHKTRPPPPPPPPHPQITPEEEEEEPDTYIIPRKTTTTTPTLQNIPDEQEPEITRPTYIVPPKFTRIPITTTPPTPKNNDNDNNDNDNIEFITELSIQKFPSSSASLIGGGTGNIASISGSSGNGNRKPVIINNMYYPDLQSALSSSATSTEKPRKRRRRTTTTTTPSPSPDLDYYEEENPTGSSSSRSPPN